MNQTIAQPAASHVSTPTFVRTAPWALLFGRGALFVVVQAVFALGFLLAGSTDAWKAGAAWWPLGVTVVNLICLAVMIALFKAEGKRYWSLFAISRQHVAVDLLALVALMLIDGPAGVFPNLILGKLLFADPAETL